jgi:glycosyltransferase involved in cell wall biosynthesis
MVVHGPYPIGEPRVARQARAALEAGFDVDVIATRRENEPPEEVVDGVRVFRLPVEHQRGGGVFGVLREYLGFTALATARVARLSGSHRYDVVQVHNPPDFLIAAAIFPKLQGARIVFDVHDLSPDLFASRFDGRRGGAFVDTALRWTERVAARLADAVVTVHEPYRQVLIGRSAPASKVTVVMNSLDESLLPQAPAPTEGSDFRVFYHGTVTAWYGLELLVEAFASIVSALPNARLEIQGEGDALTAVHDRAQALSVSSRVNAPGTYLPQAEVLALAQGASVGVIPNLPTKLNQYALSSKLFEYVALGIPVVSADLPTIRAHFDDSEIRFFRAGDAESLAEALLDVAHDPRAAAERVAAARARYEEYRWPGNAARYLALLETERPADRPRSEEHNVSDPEGAST